MLRRLFSLVLLLVLVGVAFYVWRGHQAAAPLSAEGRDRDLLEGQARAFGAEAKDKLGEVGQALRDLKVTASVKTALGLNRSLRPYAIDVSTQNQVVTLRGRVDGEELRARAEAVAAAVPDVTRVLSQLAGTSGTPAPAAAVRTLGESFDDHSLEMQVRLALSLNQNLKGSDLTVQAYRRQVTLGGDVASPAQHELALQIARDTASVDGVLDSIRVGGAAEAGQPAAPASAPAGASNTDRAAAAQRALDFNPYLNGFNLQVREAGGRLQLQGSVRTPVERDLAGLLAREAAGTPVENALELRTATP